MPSERLKKRPGTSQEKHASFVGRRDILLGIRVVQQTEENCANSSKYGHFASCCKGNHSSLESGKDSQQKKASNGKKGAGRQTNQGGGYSMEDEHVSSEERNPAFAFAAMKEALKEVCMVSILSVRTKTQTKLIVGYCLSLTIMTDEASLLDRSDDYEVLLGFSEEDETFQFWVQLFALCVGI